MAEVKWNVHVVSSFEWNWTTFVPLNRRKKKLFTATWSLNDGFKWKFADENCWEFSKTSHEIKSILKLTHALVALIQREIWFYPVCVVWYDVMNGIKVPISISNEQNDFNKRLIMEFCHRYQSKIDTYLCKIARLIIRKLRNEKNFSSSNYRHLVIMFAE